MQMSVACAEPSLAAWSHPEGSGDDTPGVSSAELQ